MENSYRGLRYTYATRTRKTCAEENLIIYLILNFYFLPPLADGKSIVILQKKKKKEKKKFHPFFLVHYYITRVSLFKSTPRTKGNQ